MRSWKCVALGAAVSVSLCSGGVAAYGSAGYTIAENFAGGHYGTNGNFSDALYPPDSNGSVGGGDVMEFINGYVGIYSKSGSLLKSSSLSNFWSNAGASWDSGLSPGDTRIIYDTSAQRWFATSGTFNMTPSGSQTGNNQILVGVSQTSDPTGGWKGFAINSSPSDSSLYADFPTLGVNGDGVFINANMFTTSGTSSSGSIDVISIPKASLTAATPSINHFKLQQVSNTNHGDSVQPINNFSASMPETMYANYGPISSIGPGGKQNYDGIAQTTLSGSITNPTLSTSQNFATTTVNNQPVGAPQSGSTTLVDANDHRFGSSLYQQPANSTSAGDVWEVFSVQNPNNSSLDGLQWLRINPSTNTVDASGLLTDSNLSLYDGSIAVTPDGHIVVSFSASSTSTDPGAYAFIGTYDSTTGTASFSANPVQLVAGTSPVTFGGSATTPARFGDYSTAVLDPSNPEAVWTFNEFGGGNGWNTQISEVSFAPVPASGSLALVGLLLLIFSLRRRDRCPSGEKKGVLFF